MNKKKTDDTFFVFIKNSNCSEREKIQFSRRQFCNEFVHILECTNVSVQSLLSAIEKVFGMKLFKEFGFIITSPTIAMASISTRAPNGNFAT